MCGGARLTSFLNSQNLFFDMIRVADTYTLILHLVYDMWDTMIKKVKEVIFQYEGVQASETSSFFNVIYDILINR